MEHGRFTRLQIIPLLLAALLCSFTMQTTTAAEGDAASGSIEISNRADALYADSTGLVYRTASQTISIRVRAVAALLVTPDETESSATIYASESVTRLFRICNTGNTPDNYTVTNFDLTAPASKLALYFDTDGSGTVSAEDKEIEINDTISPPVAPGQCVAVLAVIRANDAAANTALAFGLTARSSAALSSDALSRANEDTGTILNTVASNATLASPSDPSLPPVKLVDEVARKTIASNAALTYRIAFRNTSRTIARNVIVRDELPAALRFTEGSLRLDRQPLTEAEDADVGSVRGQRIEVRLAEVRPDQTIEITFGARLADRTPAALGVVNEAQIIGDNLTPVNSSAAIVITEPHGTVYAARSGAPVAAARVALLSGSTTNTLAEIPPGDTFATSESSINAVNTNPFIADAQGRWGFALTAHDAPVTPARYVLTVTAEGFQTRHIELTVEPSSAHGFFNLLLRALDGKPLAQAGGYELAGEQVALDSLARLAFNIPLFEASSLEITKSVDRSIVEIGDTLTYRIEVGNRTGAEIKDAVVRDVLPPSFNYASGTARIEGNSARILEPEKTNGALVFRLGVIPAHGSATLTYRVRVGANAPSSDARNTAQASGAFASGEQVETPVVSAIVRVRAGAFSTRQVIIGRVFEDMNGDGSFNSGDLPVAGVRIYMPNGQSVTTDSQGLYNFPLVDDGALVLSLDPVTVPAGMRLVESDKKDEQGWTRLLRTPLGGGALLRQNFALRHLTQAEQAMLSGDPAAIASALVGSARIPTGSAPATSAPATSAPATSALATSAPVASAARVRPAPVAVAPLAPGTYELTVTESVASVAPGDVLVLSPRADEVIKAPALALDVRVAEGWKVALQVNNQIIPETNIGIRRLDHASGTLTLSFVGINLRPGPNAINVTAISEKGAAGRSAEMRVFGRGAARRLTITPERAELRADNRDATVLRITAIDEWNNPALDEAVAVTISAGRLLAASQPLATNTVQPSLVDGEPAREQLVQLSGGSGLIRLVSAASPQMAIVRASAGTLEARTEVRYATDIRPTILVGLAEASIGRAAPENNLNNEEKMFRSRLRLFYRGAFLSNRNLLTLSYDSQRALNRTAGRDRLFELDPLDRAYQVFGDSSTRHADAESNSKLYLRLDRGRSFLQFGDYDTVTSEPARTLAIDNGNPAGAYGEAAQLALYQRRLTGVQLHLESNAGDYIVVSGARPDTAWARDLISGDELGLTRLSHADILPGSEIIVREMRDRRNPEIILERETLVRGVDYNLDSTTGTIFFLRPTPVFDSSLNLAQYVATYEHRADDYSSSVFTARGRRRFRQGKLTLGFSVAGERRAEEFGSYILGGVNAEQVLPRGGRARFEFATSRGTATVGGASLFETSERADGNAFRFDLDQPLPGIRDARLRFGFTRASGRFQNPFGGAVIGGTQRAIVNLEMRPRASSQLRFTLSDERNHTENVDNSRLTASVQATETINENLRITAGYDLRRYEDSLSDKTTVSNLVTLGADWQATDKLQLSVKREQNLGDADPTYPDATTLSANYALNNAARLFFTQRLASAPITPIADLSGSGFTASSARRETAFGIESRFRSGTALNGRYQIENGINGTDSFAVIGLGHRLPVSKQLALDLTFERGFHLAGAGESFTSGGFGFSWQPSENFRTTGRYEIRDRQGLGQVLTLGAAGKLNASTTTLARFQLGRSLFGDRRNSTLNGQLSLAFRPLDSDRAALLFSYTHRSLDVAGASSNSSTVSSTVGSRLVGALREHSDTLSTDGLYQLTKDTELYGRFALRRSGDGRADLPFVSTLTFLNQVRIQHRLGGDIFDNRFDLAAEGRFLFQPVTGSRRTSAGLELGFWATNDLRVGGGYNFTRAGEAQGATLDALRTRGGFYFTISSKLSNLFNLFGTTAATSEDASQTSPAQTSPAPEGGAR